MTELTKTQRRYILINQLRDSIYAKRVWQERPNTFVKFRVKIPPMGNSPNNIETFGWAKITSHDVWDAEYGEDLAISKALARAARIIMEKWDNTL